MLRLSLPGVAFVIVGAYGCPQVTDAGTLSICTLSLYHARTTSVYSSPCFSAVPPIDDTVITPFSSFW